MMLVQDTMDLRKASLIRKDKSRPNLEIEDI